MLPRSYCQRIANRIWCEYSSSLIPQHGYVLHWLPKFPGVIKHQLPQLAICFKKKIVFWLPFFHV